MPPSGFSQRAINGLLEFVQANYESVLGAHGASDEPAALERSIAELEQRARTAAEGLGVPGAQGLAAFMAENYRDLIAEIASGKKEQGYAMKKEIEDIGRYLEQFHI